MPNTYLPGNHTTPDQAPTLAVTGDSNTGYTSTVASCSSSDSGPDAPDSDSQAKSIRWHDFAALAGAVSSLKLKFDWTASGDVSVEQDTAGSGSAGIDFDVEYSTDGGSSWTPKLSKSKSVSGANVSGSLAAPNSGSEEVVLSVSQDLTLMQVRARADATTSATAPASGIVSSSASITTTVSNVQVEAVYASNQILVMM